MSCTSPGSLGAGARVESERVGQSQSINPELCAFPNVPPLPKVLPYATSHPQSHLWGARAGCSPCPHPVTSLGGFHRKVLSAPQELLLPER